MWLELLSLPLRPFHVDARRNVGLVLKGSVDQVRQAASKIHFLPIKGIEIIGHEQPLDPSCAFLAQLKGIQYVRLFAYRLTDIESIQSLKHLRRLEISHVGKEKSIAIDLASFPMLEHVSLEWFEGADSVFHAVKLKSLGLMYYPGSSLEVLKGLATLRQLRLTECGFQDVGALQNLTCLRWLALHGLKHLDNFTGLSGHRAIAFLWIEACRKLQRIDWLSGMTALETLRILDCGEIQGIEAVQSLPRLRHMHIHGSVKVVANDLSFLRERPNLESVMLKDLPEMESAYWRQRNKRYQLLRPDLAV